MDKRTTIIEEPPQSGDSAPNIVAFRVGRLEKAVEVGFREHNEKLDALVKNFATNTDLGALASRVASLEGDRKWVVRLVVGAVIFAVLSLIGVGFRVFK